MFPGQTDFKVRNAEKQIVVFPHDETKEPLCVAESFKFSKEDYEQVCKLRRWYRELSHKSVNPSLESSLSTESEGRSGRMGSPFCQVSSSGKESIHLPTLMQLFQPRKPLNGN